MVGLLRQRNEFQAQRARHRLRADAAVNLSVAHQARGGQMAGGSPLVSFHLADGDIMLAQEVVEQAFNVVELDWRRYVRRDPQLLRPVEPQRLVGNATKARQVLGWQARTTFKELITEMTQADLETLAGNSQLSAAS